MSRRFTLAIIIVLLFSGDLFAGLANNYYVRSKDPWGDSSNNAAMDSVFGSNWLLVDYTYDSAWLFDPGTQFIFMEGSDSNFNYLDHFLATHPNDSLMEDWVYNGGRLFINVSPTVGQDINLGFDTTIVHYPVFSDTARAYSMATAIFSGPWAVDSLYWGTKVSHGNIEGDSLVPRMVGAGGTTVLAYRGWGCGIVVIGTLSQPTFWLSDSIRAERLFQNIISFTKNTPVCPLSVKSGNITAANAGSRNHVDWTTASESVGDIMTVERSANGTEFTALASMHGKGAPSAYTWWDNAPVNGVNYYRLKLTDANGHRTYTEIASASVNGNFEIKAYPNPVLNTLTVTTSGAPAANSRISLTDITGKVLFTATPNAGAASFDMTNLAKGVYFVRYSDDEHSQTIKVTK